jgi:hypothetical protein
LALARFAANTIFLDKNPEFCHSAGGCRSTKQADFRVLRRQYSALYVLHGRHCRTQLVPQFGLDLVWLAAKSRQAECLVFNYQSAAFGRNRRGK